MKHLSNPQANFLNAAAQLIADAVQDARRTDPKGLAGLNDCLAAGGLITVRGMFAPSTGLASLAVIVTEPNGIEHVMSTCELQRVQRNSGPGQSRPIK
jgi:hypothetical protein